MRSRHPAPGKRSRGSQASRVRSGYIWLQAWFGDAAAGEFEAFVRIYDAVRGLIEAEWDVRVRQAVNVAAKTAGSLPGFLAPIVEQNKHESQCPPCSVLDKILPCLRHLNPWSWTNLTHREFDRFEWLELQFGDKPFSG